MYGGTKKEMARLLEDASKISGKKYNINNLADVYNAIHVIQKDLNITGTTSKEAATTFEGSFRSMQAAAKNVLGKIAIGDSLTKSLEGLATTVSTFVFKNFLPMVGRVVTALPSAIGSFISTAVPIISEEIQNFIPSLFKGGGNMFNEIVEGIKTMGPKMVEGAASLIESLGEGLKSGIPTFLSNALPMLLEFSEGLKENATVLINSGLDLLKNIAQGIADALPVLIEYVPTIVTNIASIINDNAGTVLATGLDILVTLGKGIIDAIPTLISNIPEIITAIVSVFEAFDWLSLGSGLMTLVKNGISMLGTAIPNVVKSIGTKAINFFKGVNWLQAGKSVITFIVNGIGNLVRKIPSKLVSIGNDAVNLFKGIDWFGLGKNVVEGIVNGIKSVPGLLMDAVTGIGKKAEDALKSFWGIKSPSRVFAKEVGVYVPAGIAKGIEDNAHVVEDALSMFDTSAMLGNVDMSVSSTRLSSPYGNNQNMNFTFNIDGAENPEQFADRFVRKLKLNMRTV